MTSAFASLRFGKETSSRLLLQFSPPWYEKEPKKVKTCRPFSQLNNDTSFGRDFENRCFTEQSSHDTRTKILSRIRPAGRPQHSTGNNSPTMIIIFCEGWCFFGSFSSAPFFFVLEKKNEPEIYYYFLGSFLRLRLNVFGLGAISGGSALISIDDALFAVLALIRLARG